MWIDARHRGVGSAAVGPDVAPAHRVGPGPYRWSYRVQLMAADATGPDTETRVDPLTGDEVVIVGSRQARPNLPADGCPFCPGGREAPEPYDVRWFPNRWPPLPDGRAEVVLYAPEHDVTLGSLPPARVRAAGGAVGRADRRPRCPRRRGLRAGVREPGPRGGRHHRPPPRPDLRLRPGPPGGPRRAGRGRAGGTDGPLPAVRRGAGRPAGGRGGRLAGMGAGCRHLALRPGRGARRPRGRPPVGGLDPRRPGRPCWSTSSGVSTASSTPPCP